MLNTLGLSYLKSKQSFVVGMEYSFFQPETNFGFPLAVVIMNPVNKEPGFFFAG